MDIIEYREFCLSLPLTEETTPFDEDTLVFKICGKMYAYASIGNFTWVGLKCDPGMAVELRERYPEVGAASHMSKVHWISLDMTGGLTDDFIRERIRDSYMLVIAGLPRKLKEEALAAQKFTE